MTDFANSLGGSWWSWMAPLSLQVALLGAIVLAADVALRKRGWVQVRYAMWLVVFVKLLLPPTLYLPTSVTAGLFDAAGPGIAATSAVELGDAADAAPVIHAAGPAENPPVATLRRMAAEPAPVDNTLAVAGVASSVGRRKRLTLHTWMMLVWAGGLGVLLGTLVRRSASLWRTVRGCPPVGPQVQEALGRAAVRLGVNRRIRAVAGGSFPGVAVFGILRPTIVLPADSLEGFTARELDHVLLHELAHIKRGDLLVNAAASLLQVVFWFHPLVWLAGRRLRALRELCCDASVAGLLRENTPSYRSTLAGVARRMIAERAQFAVGLLGLFEGKSHLRERLEHLARAPWRRRRLKIAIALAAVMALAVFVVPMAPGRAEADGDVIKFKKLEMSDTRAEAIWQVSTSKPAHFVAGFYSVKDNRPDGWGSTIINPDKPSGPFVLRFSWRRDKATVGMRFSTAAGTTDDWGALKKLASALDADSMFEIPLPEGDLSMEPLAQKPAPLSPNEYVNIMKIETKKDGVETSVIYLAIKPVMHGKGDNSFDAEKAYEAFRQGRAGGRVAPDINAKASQLVVNSSTRSDVLRLFGEPTKYVWGNKTFTKHNLPETYIMRYPEGFNVVMSAGVVNEVRHTAPSRYLLLGRISIGSSPEEVFAVLGKPQDTVEGGSFPMQAEQGVFYRDIGGRRGYCYYGRSRDNGVRFFFSNNKVSAIYVTGTPAAASTASESDDTPPTEDREPRPMRIRKNVASIPKYDPDSQNSFQVDLRGANLEGLDLANSADDLAYAMFDTDTTWPEGEKMTADFDPDAVLELGKNPGLGTRGLHARGITGKGVGIAVIDQTLLVEHSEYADRLRTYEEINIHRGSPASMHGPATASIAAGKTVGVAPEADLYHIALWPIEANKKASYENIDFSYYARAIRRVLEINRGLSEKEKIRAISLSIGWGPTSTGYEEMTAAVDEAKEAGILITSSSIAQTHGFHIHGLGRKPMADPDLFESYEPGLFWAKQFWGRGTSGTLMIPMDSRTTAGPAGAGGYAFYRQGGWSWITPYLAGVYALACQVKPDITPEEFLSLAMETGRTIEFTQGGKSAPLGPIIDPVALIGKLEESAKMRGASP